MNKLILIALLTFTVFSQTTRIATLCSEGQYWNSTNGLCQSCPKQGGYNTICTSESVVTEVQCSSETDTITVSSGTVQVPRVYDTNTKQCVKSSCTQTVQNSLVCKTCATIAGSQQCVECNSGFFRIGNICFQQQAGSSIQANANCATPYATSTNLCKSCLPGYFLLENQQENNLRSPCVACQVSNCSICASYSNCSECVTGYYFETSSYSCVQGTNQSCTAANCLSCLTGKPTQCQSCVIGYFLNTTTSTCTSCKSADPNCNACLQSTSLKLGQTCTTCGTGYFLNSATGKCAQNLANCEVSVIYTGDNETVTCNVCNNGFYKTATNSTKQIFNCSPCGSNMLYCQTTYDNSAITSTTPIPTQCNTGYQLVSEQTGGNTCYKITSSDPNCNLVNTASPYVCKGCESGYFVSSNKCVQCTTLSNCSLCIANTTGSGVCTVCNGGYYLNTTNSTCAACPNGTATCSSATVSLTCSTGYILVPTNGANLCTALPTKTVTNLNNCNIANPALTECTSCNSGYSLYNFACVNTVNTGCETFNTSLSACTKCQNYYQLQNGGCVASSSFKCVLPSSTTSSQCQTCQYGYANENSICVPCTNYVNFICRANSNSVTPTPTPSSSTTSSGTTSIMIAQLFSLILAGLFLA